MVGGAGTVVIVRLVGAAGARSAGAAVGARPGTGRRAGAKRRLRVLFALYRHEREYSVESLAHRGAFAFSPISMAFISNAIFETYSRIIWIAPSRLEPVGSVVVVASMSSAVAGSVCRYSTVISLASLNYPASLLVFVADIKEFKALLDQRKPQPFNSCHIQPTSASGPSRKLALVQQRPDML